MADDDQMSVFARHTMGELRRARAAIGKARPLNVALRPDNLNLISLCTGGGGLDLGVELAMPSARSVVLVEREAFAVSNWSARYSKVSWLKPLFGAMLPPSTAALGVASWMASLAASRASLTASPESEPGKRRRTRSLVDAGASSSSPAPGSSSSRTSAACSRRSPASIRARYGSGVTYSDWVSTLREDCSRRQRSAQAMKASASLSSQWPTTTISGPQEPRGHE
jgi:hypothetical protein